MGKLVLRLPDGARREFPLERERLTIGRRADNDICLPFPAVSGEHAAVVTILADSFLEDLGSTNGTLVNGKAITKHFLRDYDEIDIGQQMLVYVTGEYAIPAQSPLPRDNETVAVTANGGATVGDDEATVVHAKRASATDLPAEAATTGALRNAEMQPPASSTVHEAVDAAALGPGDVVLPVDEPPAPAATLEILDGPSAGVAVNVDRDDFVLGRPGLQIAALRRTAGGFRLVPLEGDAPPRVNGNEIAREGAALDGGDEIEIAGTRVAYRSPA